MSEPPRVKIREPYNLARACPIRVRDFPDVEALRSRFVATPSLLFSAFPSKREETRTAIAGSSFLISRPYQAEDLS